MVDLLIIGAGGAGMVAALEAKARGASVQILSKTLPTRSQTCMAQGGINAALSHAGDDSIEHHIADTLKSAQGLADEAAVKRLCSDAPDAIAWLNSMGVAFSRDENGKIAQRKLGGAYGARACYAQDYTGLKILHTLYDQCLKADIEIISDAYVLELITEGEGHTKHAVGATVLHTERGTTQAYYGRSVVMASGGYSRLFHHYSTNDKNSSGDGIALALKAGATVSDLEFVQFHPTGLANSSILISESARGAGGYLLNANKERFTNETAPRDVVARAIHAELIRSGAVYLDIRHLGETFIMHELPQEAKLANIYEGVDVVNELIPIRPVAHYTMGGIDIDANGESSLKGLFAIGECANQKVHGGNRLGGNSLLELVVFGRHVARHAHEYATSVQQITKQSCHTEQADASIEAIKALQSSKNFYEAHQQLGEALYEKVGIVRSAKSIADALKLILRIESELTIMGPTDKSLVCNTNLVEYIEFTNIIMLAKQLAISALKRKESRGAHFREDFPTRDDEEFSKHSCITSVEHEMQLTFCS